MSLCPQQPIPPVPEDTARVARAAFRARNPYLILRDRLGTLFNRVELVAETLRAALNDIAVVAPDWLCALAPPEWHERYDVRIEDMRLPEAGPKRDAFVAGVGADGFFLLDALAQPDAPAATTSLPVVETLRRVWARHFERPKDGKDGGARLRPVQGRGPGDRVESPYNTEARFRTKANTTWTGTMVHFTETCDAGAPPLVVHADTTPANVHDALRTAPSRPAAVPSATSRVREWRVVGPVACRPGSTSAHCQPR